MLIHYKKPIFIAELVQQLIILCASREVKTNKALFKLVGDLQCSKTCKMSEENSVFKYFLTHFSSSACDHHIP